MQNLKIKLNSDAEAEEVKRLAVKAGYTLDALFGKKWSAEFCYLLLCEDMSAGFGNEIMADGDKPLSIGELRAMANPMKEYLDKKPDGSYELIVSNGGCVDRDWIEIPEGAEAFGYTGIVHTFYKDDFRSFFNENTDGQWDGRSETWIGRKEPVILWQREQDEPFLTPECTLNDQYAEIEQVRQAINKSWGSVGAASGGAAQANGGVDATLSQRQSQYGCYEDVAHVTQQILSALRIGNYDELPAPMKESLHMIASKMARIVNGDPEYLDNRNDIGGYAKLIEKLIEGN